MGSPDDLALWAKRSLPEKNKLTTADAERIEGAFAVTLAIVAMPEPDQPAAPSGNPPNPVTPRPLSYPGAHPAASWQPTPQSQGTHQGIDKRGIDKSALALPEPRRLRDRDHLKYVAQQACLVCGRAPCDPHHLRFTQSPALGRKVSDEFTVSLCRGHHRELHRHGDEAAWWGERGIDPTIAARALWLETHPLPAVANNLPSESAASPA